MSKNTMVTASWSTWLQVLKDADACASRRPVMPVLAYGKLSVTKDGCTFEVTDLENSVSLDFVGTPAGTGYGQTLIPIRTAKDLVTHLNAGISRGGSLTAQVTVGMQGSTLVVSGFGRQFEVAEIGAELADFPQLPERPDEETAIFDADYLHRAVSFVAGAAGDDFTLPMLTGVRMEIDPGAGTVAMAATDRYRLAVCEVVDAAALVKSEVLIPARSLAKLLPDSGKLVMRHSGTADGYVQFVAEDRTVTIRLLDATFPSYRSLIPANGETWTVGRERLVQDIAAAKPMLDRGPVRFTFTAHAVQVAGSPERRAVSDAVTSHRHETAFNPQFMTAALKAFGTDRVDIRATSATKPHLLSADVPGVARPVYLVMPVRIPG